MKVYIDILFIINFIMDFISIGVVSVIMSSGIKLSKHILSAIVGGIFGVYFFVTDISFFGNLTASLLSGTAMCGVAFLPCPLNEFLKRTGLMYITSALFAGIGILDMSLFGGGIIKNGIFYINTPRMLITSVIIYMISKLFFSKLKRRASEKLSGVILEYNKRRVRLTGLTDTGNGLYDPISGRPVILIEPDVLSSLISENCTPENLSEWIDSERLRYIPYHTVGGEGVLIGIRLDRAVIDGKTIEGVIAAVSINSLKYPVLLHAGM